MEIYGIDAVIATLKPICFFQGFTEKLTTKEAILMCIGPQVFPNCVFAQAI